MHRRSFIKLALAGAAATLAPAALASAAPGPDQQPTFFPETGHNIGFKFRRFYYEHGGPAIFGLPLTETFDDNGLIVQYFERARFEYRQDMGGGVTLSLLGQELAAGRGEPEFQWIPADPGNGRRYMPESGHTVGGAFLDFWERSNGLLVFGYPVSEELYEIGSDGAPRIVQYFQRARFELYPEAAFTPNIVQLSQIGRVALDRRSELGDRRAPVAPLTLLGSGTTGFPGSAEERRVNIYRATMLFDGAVVEPNQEFSFIGNHDFSERAGFVEGYGIIGGKLDRVIGGGLCQVSTTMFRAVANAGLTITRRTAHTYVVYFYENIPGFDATVYTPDIDFRWRNNTPGPVTISAIPDLTTERVTFDIYGTTDGRQVNYRGPNVRNVVQPGRATWEYDASLPRGARRQMVHGRAGMDVTLIREVKLPDGRMLHLDRFETHYRPWDDFWVFGPGVTPPAGARVI
jgi:hypothetical protein